LWSCDACVGDFHQFRATTAQRDADLLERAAIEAEPRGPVVIRAADVAQFRLGGFLKPVDAQLVEVGEHRKHFSMIVLQTITQRLVIRGFINQGSEPRLGACATRLARRSEFFC